MRAVSSPVVNPSDASFPLATIAFAPIHEMRIIQTYMHNCMSGEVKLMKRSPFENSS